MFLSPPESSADRHNSRVLSHCAPIPRCGENTKIADVGHDFQFSRFLQVNSRIKFFRGRKRLAKVTVRRIARQPARISSRLNHARSLFLQGFYFFFRTAISLRINRSNEWISAGRSPGPSMDDRFSVAIQTACEPSGYRFACKNAATTAGKVNNSSLSPLRRRLGRRRHRCGFVCRHQAEFVRVAHRRAGVKIDQVFVRLFRQAADGQRKKSFAFFISAVDSNSMFHMTRISQNTAVCRRLRPKIITPVKPADNPPLRQLIGCKGNHIIRLDDIEGFPFRLYRHIDLLPGRLMPQSEVRQRDLQTAAFQFDQCFENRSQVVDASPGMGWIYSPSVSAARANALLIRHWAKIPPAQTLCIYRCFSSNGEKGEQFSCQCRNAAAATSCGV